MSEDKTYYDRRYRFCRYIKYPWDVDSFTETYYFPDEICDDRTEQGDCCRDGKACDYKVYELKEVATPPPPKGEPK